MIFFSHSFGRLAHRLKQRFCDQSGVAAIEFAFIGPVFLYFIVCFIEFGIINLTDLDISIALDKVARGLIVSQDNSGDISSADNFKTALCKNIHLISNCAKSDVFKLQARLYNPKTNGDELFRYNQLRGELSFETNVGQQSGPLPWCIGAPGSEVFVELEYLAPIYATGWFRFNVTNYQQKGIIRPIKIRSLYVREPASVLSSGSTPSC